MITNTKFYKENKEEIIGGLVGGLVIGLVWGLVIGLVWGLVVILVNWSSALPYFTNFKSVMFLILGIIILIEILYWLDSEKPKGKATTSFVLKKKFEAFCEVMLGLSAIAQIYILQREIDFSKYFPEILKWFGYIGIGILSLGIIIGLVYLWIQLNKLKYQK